LPADPDEEGEDFSALRARGLIRLLAAVLLLAVSSGCTAAPADESPREAVPSFSPVTRMGTVQEAGKLLIGVPRDMPPWAFGAGGGPFQGFMVDTGRYVAESLGVRPVFVRGSAGEIVKLADQGGVDMSFALEPITAAWLAEHVTSNPYFIAHQRLLVRRSSAIRGVADLSGKSVCQAVDPLTEVSIKDLRVGAGKVRNATARRCIAFLRRGKVDAVTASDVKLMVASSPGTGLVIVGDQLSTEGYGIVGAPEGKGWSGYLDATLSSFKSSGEWLSSYDRWIADRVPDPLTETPHMTAEEAAALFPEAVP
jgi:ABC-type amino acid transport substrate-binding protein